MKQVYTIKEIDFYIPEGNKTVKKGNKQLSTFQIKYKNNYIVCERKDLFNVEIVLKAHILLRNRYVNYFLFKNPNHENHLRDWGFYNVFVENPKIKNQKTKDQCDIDNLWLNPRKFQKQNVAAISLYMSEHIQNKFNEVFEVTFTSNTEKGYNSLDTNQRFGINIYANHSHEKDYLYFFPNTEAEVEIVFDVIEKLGFFEGWEKNSNYKKSSQDNSTISYETEENINEDIQSENYVEPATVEENTVEIEIEEEIELSAENSDFVSSEHEDNYEIDYRPEGREKIVIQTVYERNPENRRICIEHYKFNDCDKRIKCQLCGFDFEAFYGDLGRDFIEVHHKIPLSETRREIYIDPKEDLIPVCSNCHRMLHRNKNEFLSVDNLKELISK